MGLKPASHEEVLRRVWLFSGLHRSEIAQVGSVAVVRRYTPGQTVVRQGDQPGDLFAVLSGRLQVSWNDAEGSEELLSILEGGDVFGELALLDDRPRSSTVTAMETCELLAVERAGFHTLLASVPTLALNLLPVLARLLRQLTDRPSMSLLDLRAGWQEC